MFLKKKLIPIWVGILLPVLTYAQVDTVKKNIDTVKKATEPVKSYKDVITAKAKSQRGLFTVHKIDEKYYFEIPDSLLDRDILSVCRISKAAAGIRPSSGMLGYAGDEVNERIVNFSKGPGNKLFIKSVSYGTLSKDSSVNGMYRSVVNSSLKPLIASFPIRTFSPNNDASIIEITDYLNGDNDVLFFDKGLKQQFKLGAIQPDRSYTEGIKSFPENVEIRTLKTYVAGESFATYELNSSIVLLPREPMQPRYADARVGYFSTGYLDFDAPQGIKPTTMITRWRLEPKGADIEKYKSGELVEPKKPIVYYIDPATPKKWVPYLIQGINDWQKAFEKAGFKNAIYALEAPTDDSTWSLEDARHNVLVYKPSVVPNASGPHIHDPRTGEILETHINWYHNIMDLVHDWYMIQAGPNDPKARKMEFDDSLMGQLIRFVSSHEVGHTLGLTHNMGATSTVPTDSLRSQTYLDKNGFCPSIMDYARFNYVAQPQDGISAKGLMPRIGMYDEWAIEWGYRWLPELKTEKEEKAYMNQWIISKLKQDKRYWFGDETALFDPRRQTEDLGDDAMKAGYYGIENLKRVASQLKEWTKQPNEDYQSLLKIKNQVTGQFDRYLLHVTKNVGGMLSNKTTVEQNEPSFQFTDRDKQRSAVRFLNSQIFSTPDWYVKSESSLYPYLGGPGAARNLMVFQYSILGQVTSQATLRNLWIQETMQPDKAYTGDMLLTDLEAEIWKELPARLPVDVYRRNLQKLYAERLIALLKGTPLWVRDDNLLFTTAEYYQYTDRLTVIKTHLKNLLTTIEKAIPTYKDKTTRLHLIEIKERLKEAIKVDKEVKPEEKKEEKSAFRISNESSCWSNEINF